VKKQKQAQAVAKHTSGIERVASRSRPDMLQQAITPLTEGKKIPISIVNEDLTSATTCKVGG
jgi:hypothetical protein